MTILTVNAGSHSLHLADVDGDMISSRLDRFDRPDSADRPDRGIQPDQPDHPDDRGRR